MSEDNDLKITRSRGEAMNRKDTLIEAWNEYTSAESLITASEGEVTNAARSRLEVASFLVLFDIAESLRRLVITTEETNAELV